MKKLYILSAFLLVTLTIALRLYKVGEPIADWHSFRQVDTAAVARIFVREGIDLLHPRYHDLSNIQTGKDNPEGYRMVEVPIYQGIAAGITRAFPNVPIEVSLRLVTVLSAAGTTLILIGLMSALTSPLVGLLSGGVYAILPYSMYYGRTILPETFAVFWAMLSVYGVYLVCDRSKKNGVRWVMLFFSAAAGAVSILVKPMAGFLLIPVPYLLLWRGGISFRSMAYAGVYAGITLIPFFWWRNWILQFPEGIPAFDWLFNKGGIRFKGAWFEWLFAKRLGELMLGYWGLIPLGLGFIAPASKKEGLLLHIFGLGGIAYLTVFAGGNVQHDYYQIILLPVVSMYVGKGLAFLFLEKRFSPVARYTLLVTSLLFMLAFSWYTMRTFYWINRPEIIEAGEAADKLLPIDAKVIAPYNGDTTFLYQTKRRGWPLGFDIDEKIAMGATHYVTVSPTDADFETKELAEKYTVLVRNDKFAIIDLTKPRTP